MATKIQKTRVNSLGFAFCGQNNWRFVDLESSQELGMTAYIGPAYKSKAEILADVGSFAECRGMA